MDNKIRNPQDLDALRDQARADVDIRAGAKDLMITIHMGTCGIAAGARDILTEVAEELERSDVQNVTLRRSGCLGLCAQEPMLTLVGEDGRQFRYAGLDVQKVRRIVRDHIMSGKPVLDYLIAENNTEER